MKINLNGELINLNLVWKIGKIQQVAWSDRSFMGMGGYNEISNLEEVESLRFHVYITGNKDTIMIYKNIKNEDLSSKQKTLADFTSKYDELLTLWLGNQSDIKTFDFK